MTHLQCWSLMVCAVHYASKSETCCFYGFEICAFLLMCNTATQRIGFSCYSYLYHEAMALNLNLDACFAKSWSCIIESIHLHIFLCRRGPLRSAWNLGFVAKLPQGSNYCSIDSSHGRGRFAWRSYCDHIPCKQTCGCN